MRYSAKRTPAGWRVVDRTPRSLGEIVSKHPTREAAELAADRLNGVCARCRTPNHEHDPSCPAFGAGPIYWGEPDPEED